MSWIDVKDKLPDLFADIFKVKTENGDQERAYFYKDKMSWIAFYGQKTNYWWSHNTNEPMFDVTHWWNKEDNIK